MLRHLLQHLLGPKTWKYLQEEGRERPPNPSLPFVSPASLCVCRAVSASVSDPQRRNGGERAQQEFENWGLVQFVLGTGRPSV